MITLRTRVTDAPVARVSTAEEALSLLIASEILRDLTDSDAENLLLWAVESSVISAACAAAIQRDQLRAWDDHGVSALSPCGWILTSDDLRVQTARDRATFAALDSGLSAEVAQRIGEKAELLEERAIAREHSARVRGSRALQRLAEVWYG